MWVFARVGATGQFREGSCLTVQVGVLELESARRLKSRIRCFSAQHDGVSFVAAQNLRHCHVALLPKFALVILRRKKHSKLFATSD